jgi:hypothetical protein
MLSVVIGHTPSTTPHTAIVPTKDSWSAVLLFMPKDSWMKKTTQDKTRQHNIRKTKRPHQSKTRFSKKFTNNLGKNWEKTCIQILPIFFVFFVGRIHVPR